MQARVRQCTNCLRNILVVAANSIEFNARFAKAQTKPYGPPKPQRGLPSVSVAESDLKIASTDLASTQGGNYVDGRFKRLGLNLPRTPRCLLLAG